MRTTHTLLGVVIWFSLVTLACTLSSTGEETPIVVVPPATPTAQPPISYSTPLPGTQDAQVNSSQQQQRIEVEMFNLLNQVQTDRLFSHVATLVDFHTRHVNSPTNQIDYGIGGAANYILEQFEAIRAQSPTNFTVFEQPFEMEYNGVRSVQRNIVGYIQGTDTGAGVIVVGAHYDSRTLDLTDASSYAPGAVDNASGVAAVIEIARIMSQRPRRASIMFVLFAAEEVGAIGSKRFIEGYLQNFNIQDVMMINIDTVGSYNAPDGTINDRDIRLFSSPGVPRNQSPARQLARSIHFIAFNHQLDLNVMMQDAIDREGRFGDHNSFDDAGYPAVRFIEALEDTSKREGADTLDGVEASYLASATRTILGVIEALAAGPPPPRNLTLRDLGDGTSTLVWEPSPDAARYVVGLRSSNSLIYDRPFTVVENTSGAWENFNWQQFEAIAVAAVDANGVIGRFSQEILVPK
ncbi:MAG: M20/M25/M40 family metallo-hydrolase [Chloroflexota bacterium]